MKKYVCVILCVCFVGKIVSIFRGNWMEEITTAFLPLLTYEQQYGSVQAEYAMDYNVPDSFDCNQLKEENKNLDKSVEGVEYEQTKIGEEQSNENLQQNEKEDKSEVAANVSNNHVTYTKKQLGKKDFLLSKIFVVDSNTNMTDEELDLKNLLDKDLSIADLKVWDGSDDKKCKILIYHTHGSESFADSRPGVLEDTVIGVGSYLSEILEQQYGIPVYHDTTVYDMINGVNDRSGAYENAYQNVTKILKDNPSIEVVIDLHRDGVDEDVRLVTDVNGKKTAKIMFLNGVSRSNTNGEIDYLKNPNRLENLAFSFQMCLKGRELYGDYIRKIYVKSLRFNMHLMPRTTLIEAGAQNNTLEEEKNAMEPLAEILNSVLSEKRNEPQ